MAQVIGLGGVFFKVADPEATMDWYRNVLGVSVNEYGGADFLHANSAQGRTQSARTIFAPFKTETDYFQPSGAAFMINLMVDDLDGVLELVQAAGVPLEGDRQDYDYGRFAWVMDPNGIKVELWEPIEPAS
ncbi:glyoxalase [Marinicauda pacifica]|uniref:VOC family protein n=1 Tax=Marinicauda pacifica TaxID=1133559 RepID=A0A4S2HDL6_9PROT|nr:VOC family protein [Marinicauda pacifica]TGY93858.1 VOC family protein [Marinicauda pacifica]GGE30916.1 glyoxalase [Marinicauda pacifica]